MDYDWSILLQETVQKGNLIPLPADVKDNVGINHEISGPSIHWNYEKNSQFVVLSAYSLREPNYVNMGRFKIYEGDRIRIPENLDPVIKSRFREGVRVVYLAYEEMTTGENATTYLLTNTQVQQLLPSEAETPQRSSQPDLQSALMDLPGFIEPP